MTVVIIDYGMGNLASVQHSIALCGGDVVVSQNPDDLKTASGIILPGVGAYGDGMAHLHKNGWVEVLRTEAVDNKIPFLGICLGMQLLADRGSEGKSAGEAATPGLGFIAGDTVRMQPQDAAEKIPHVGWNEVHQNKEHWILEGIEDHKDFYFVHSYHFVAKSGEDVIATTPYCGRFSSVVAHENIIGVQFHPEKSQIVGFQLLKNFLQRC